MIKTFPVEIGQTVYLGVLDGYAPEMPVKKMMIGKVVKIGRQYLYVEYNPNLKPLRFAKDTFAYIPFPVNPYDTKYIILKSEHEFQEETKRREYRKAIAFCLSGGFGSTVRTLDISLGALKKIYEVLESEGVANLNPVE